MSPVVPLQDPHAPVDQLGRTMHDLRISVMDRCNFRCPYCMPKDTFGEGYRFLGAAERLSFPEITRLAALFVALGVRKLRLTGGEPLLRAGLPELVGDLAALPNVTDVALTTNGVLLARHAEELKAQGLARVTVSLDALDPAVFHAMSGGFGTPGEILDGIEAAIAAGLAAWAGAWLGAPLLPGRLTDVAALAGAITLGTLAYGMVVWIFRRALPLGKFAQ